MPRYKRPGGGWSLAGGRDWQAQGHLGCIIERDISAVESPSHPRSQESQPLPRAQAQGSKVRKRSPHNLWP